MKIVTALRAGNMATVQRLLAELTEPALPTDPVELEAVVDELDPERPGSWGEIRAWRDYGRITAAEYDQLAELSAVSMEGS